MRLSLWRDRALDLNAPAWWAGLSLPMFGLYFGGVVGGSILQGIILPGPYMGWFQQLGGILGVVLGVLFLRDRRLVFAWFPPEGRWLSRALLVGLSISAAGEVAGLLIGDKPTTHGFEYFAYQATMPGISEELGFRGLVLGLLTASLLNRSSSIGRVATILTSAAIPFAALHILDASGFELIVLFCFTLYAGIALGWLRLTTGSLFAAILAHNVANVGSGVLDYMMQLM